MLGYELLATGVIGGDPLAAPLVTLDGLAPLAADATLGATGTVSRFATGALLAQSDLSVAGTRTALSTALLGASATLSVSGSRTAPASVLLGALASLEATATTASLDFEGWGVPV